MRPSLWSLWSQGSAGGGRGLLSWHGEPGGLLCPYLQLQRATVGPQGCRPP